MKKHNVFHIYADKVKYSCKASYEWDITLPDDELRKDNYILRESDRKIPQERYTDPNSIVLLNQHPSGVFMVWREKNRYCAVYVSDWSTDDYRCFWHLRQSGLSVRDALSFIEL